MIIKCNPRDTLGFELIDITSMHVFSIPAISVSSSDMMTIPVHDDDTPEFYEVVAVPIGVRYQKIKLGNAYKTRSMKMLSSHIHVPTQYTRIAFCYDEAEADAILNMIFDAYSDGFLDLISAMKKRIEGDNDDTT